jgi:hypothetical protein
MSSTFLFTASPTDATRPLGLTVYLGDTVVFDVDQLVAQQQIAVEFDNEIDDVEYVIKISLKNKTHNHTIVDSQGTIISDSSIELSNILLDGVNIDQLFFNKAVYTHSFNSNVEPIKDRVFGIIGCNGTVEFKFFTPSYIWLLENL